MSGLVGYGSSEEDDEPERPKVTKDVGDKSPTFTKQSTSEHSHNKNSRTSSNQTTKPIINHPDSHDNGTTHEEPNHSLISESTIHPLTETAPRAALLQLTMPSVPNLDIPPTPPGSPPSAMTAKVAKFLELKSQGVHFNEKLASSSSLKNPSLFGKLSVFAGLSSEDQYATSLPTELWDPNGFPAWAYKDELGKAQESARKVRDEALKKGTRPGVQFVKGRVN